jgi:hypothetical protein
MQAIHQVILKVIPIGRSEESVVVGLADTSSNIVAELALDERDAANWLDAELAEQLEIEWRRERELQVIAQVVDDSSICAQLRNCFFLVVAVLLLIIVGVVVGVVVPLGGRDGNPPTMAPTAPAKKTTMPTMAPTASATISKFTQLLYIIGAG